MKREAVELLFNSIKNEETLVKRLALLIERTNNTILEDACAPVATGILIDIHEILSFLESKYPGYKFEYKGPVFRNNEVEGLNFNCEMPERFFKKSDRYIDSFRDSYSLTQNEEYTERRSKDWSDHTFHISLFPQDLYEVKYL